MKKAYEKYKGKIEFVGIDCNDTEDKWKKAVAAVSYTHLGLPLALLGNFQRYVVLRLGKFPNKLRYFLRKYPAACRPSARLPVCLSAVAVPAACLPV